MDTGTFDSKDCMERYRRLMVERPELFTLRPDAGIRILSAPEDIASARDEAGRTYRQDGMSDDDLRVGVLTAGPFTTFVRDAVRFPDGRKGLYQRVLVPNGVVIVPFCGGEIILVRIFRHSLGGWVLETPRGMVDDGLSTEKVARRELKEEVGSEFISFHDLGIIHTTSSITPEVMHIVAGEITPPGEVGHGEGIARAVGLPTLEIERMIGDGRITDAPTIAAYMRARLAGLP
jgi:ADP-ribose pyrophosphatase